jgi:hypothetical protein
MPPQPQPKGKALTEDEFSTACEGHHLHLVGARDADSKRDVESRRGHDATMTALDAQIGVSLTADDWKREPTSVGISGQRLSPCMRARGTERILEEEISPQRIVRPGAYRIQPGQPGRLARYQSHDNSWLPGDQVDDSQPSSPERLILPATITLDATLAPAAPVAALPKATEIDAAHTSANVWRRRAICFVLLLFIVTALSMTVGLVATEKKRNQIDSSERNVTFVEFRETLFPNVTFQDRRGGTLSPAENALKWLQDDAEDSTMVMWRMMQRYSLAVVYFALGGQTWLNNTDWLSNKDECSWKIFPKVAGDIEPCDKYGRFIDLSLFENNATGYLPTEIGFLTMLKRIELADNRIFGSIPTEIGLLSQLEFLYMRENEVEGTIPTEIGLMKLAHIDFRTNRLTGGIPSEIGLLPGMSTVDLSRNSLSGTIPTEFGLLSSLEVWILQSNSLFGVIPTEVGYMTSLIAWRLDINILSGTIPTEIGHLQRLSEINLSSNKLSGTMPRQITWLPSLAVLYLQKNNVVGPVPSEM